MSKRPKLHRQDEASLVQGDVVSLKFNLPQGLMEHPVIILSRSEVIRHEHWFTGIMMTTELWEDEYSYPLLDAMFIKPLRKTSEARLHLISGFDVTEVLAGPFNQMKPDDLVDLIDTIRDHWAGDDL